MEAGRGQPGDGERNGKHFLPTAQAAVPRSLGRRGRRREGREGCPTQADQPFRGQPAPWIPRECRSTCMGLGTRKRGEAKQGPRLPVSANPLPCPLNEHLGSAVPGESTDLSSVRNPNVCQPYDSGPDTSPLRASVYWSIERSHHSHPACLVLLRD